MFTQGILLFILAAIVIPLFHCCLAYFISKKKSYEVISFDGLDRKSMSLLIPCYNEEVVIKSAISSIKKLSYSNLEVIFINDGSSDRTLDILKKEFKLKKISYKSGVLESKDIINTYESKTNKNIFVIDKVNGGKADSLNAGINLSSNQYVVTLDADSILKEDALDYINYTLQDEDVIAVGGNVVAAQGVCNYNGSKIYTTLKSKYIERVQFIEYLRGFYILKNSYSKINALSVISGAFGVFNKDIMFEVGGFADTVGEDIDITIKFSKYAKDNNKKIAYNDRALCFTELPNTWGDLSKQRIRWQKAFLDAIKNHRAFILKNIITNSLAFVMLFESFLLLYLTTIVTLVGYICLFGYILRGHTIDSRVYIMFAIGIFMFILHNVITFRIMDNTCLSREKLSISEIIITLFYEFLFYRPIMNIIIIYGSIEFIFKPGGWNKVSRIGVSDDFVGSEMIA